MTELKDYQPEFSEWILNVIPSSYLNWINNKNIDKRLNEIKELFKSSFSIDNIFIFDINHLDAYESKIKECCKNRKNTPFGDYSFKALSDAPNSIINKYFILFIESYKEKVLFKTATEFILLINDSL